MTSVTATDYRTMNPMDKFRSPRPAPAAPGLARSLVSSSPSEALQLHKPLPPTEVPPLQRPSRSQSPTPRWVSARRLFGLKPSKRGSSSDRSKGGAAAAAAASCSDNEDAASLKSCHSSRSTQSFPSSLEHHHPTTTRSTTPSGGSSRSRDMSPEALRRFLCDDKPPVATTTTTTTTPLAVAADPGPVATTGLSIPEQIMEENEDDDNFASHAAAGGEGAPCTLLSPPPPPFLRSLSSPSITSCVNASSDTIVPNHPPAAAADSRSERNTAAGRHSAAFKLHIPKSRFSLSAASGASSYVLTTPFSPTSSSSVSSRSRSSRGGTGSSYFEEGEGGCDRDDEESEETEEEEDDLRFLSPRDDDGKEHSFAGYSLPPQTSAEVGQKHHHNRDPWAAQRRGAGEESPRFLARCDNGLPVCDNATLLNLPTIDAGLDDLSSDAGWMADIIRPRES